MLWHGCREGLACLTCTLSALPTAENGQPRGAHTSGSRRTWQAPHGGEAVPVPRSTHLWVSTTCLLTWSTQLITTTPATLTASSWPKVALSESEFERPALKYPGVTVLEVAQLLLELRASWGRPSQQVPPTPGQAPGCTVLSGSTPARCSPSAPLPHGRRRWWPASCNCCLGLCGRETGRAVNKQEVPSHSSPLGTTMATSGPILKPKLNTFALGHPGSLAQHTTSSSHNAGPLH
ncbi:hypothetical protein P7K49_029850 [Saguinus oedipus]|uniref:Uncharacterized protein n=1 Tax=Saguinus oedipus TaxID=9490 RepID=A0ABQ9U8U8_SAGOE|nr:hypothetical protein P7K49_029850 [Saguinus oedipus]